MGETLSYAVQASFTHYEMVSRTESPASQQHRGKTSLCYYFFAPTQVHLCQTASSGPCLYFDSHHLQN